MTDNDFTYQLLTTEMNFLLSTSFLFFSSYSNITAQKFKDAANDVKTILVKHLGK